MIKTYTVDNILDLMSGVQMAQKEQLEYFFRGELEEPFIGQLLDNMVYDKQLCRSLQYGIYETISRPQDHHFSRDTVMRMLDAFWLIAKWGSINVRYCYTMQYPMQYYVIMMDGSEYDISIIKTEEDARESMLSRRYPVGNGGEPVIPEEDPICHIAIVYTEEMGQELASPLRRFGFDVVYVYNADTNDCALLEI